MAEEAEVTGQIGATQPFTFDSSKYPALTLARGAGGSLQKYIGITPGSDPGGGFANVNLGPCFTEALKLTAAIAAVALECATIETGVGAFLCGEALLGLADAQEAYTECINSHINEPIGNPPVQTNLIVGKVGSLTAQVTELRREAVSLITAKLDSGPAPRPV